MEAKLKYTRTYGPPHFQEKQHIHYQPSMTDGPTDHPTPTHRLEETNHTSKTAANETELKTEKPTYLNHTFLSSYKNPVYKNVKLKKITLETHPEQKKSTQLLMNIHNSTKMKL